MATTAQSPFFRLPRELRDAINGLVALDTEPLRYELSSKTGQPIQKKAPITSDVGSGCPPLEGEKEAYEGIVRVWQRTENTASENGLDRVCKQFIVEYSATLERRIESLISFGLGEPRLADFFWMRGKWVRLESSRAGSSTAPSIHALTIPVPVVSKVTTLHAEHHFVSPEKAGPKNFRFTLSELVLQQLNNPMNAADWKSSKNLAKERMLWFQCFKRQTNAIKG